MGTRPSGSPWKRAKRLLREPYLWVLSYDKVSDKWSARISEFPGCSAEGSSSQEAVSNLENAAILWLVSIIKGNQPIPVPLDMFGLPFEDWSAEYKGSTPVHWDDEIGDWVND